MLYPLADPFDKEDTAKGRQQFKSVERILELIDIKAVVSLVLKQGNEKPQNDQNFFGSRSDDKSRVIPVQVANI